MDGDMEKNKGDAKILPILNVYHIAKKD